MPDNIILDTDGDPIVLISVTDVVRNAGSVVLMAGTEAYLEGLTEGEPTWPEGTIITFGVDHRCAIDIIGCLAAGEDITVGVPSWAIVGVQ